MYCHTNLLIYRNTNSSNMYLFLVMYKGHSLSTIIDIVEVVVYSSSSAFLRLARYLIHVTLF